MEAIADRHARPRQVIGWNQDFVSEAVVALIGVGAVGNHSALTLAMCGVRRIILVDPDVKESSNLSRSPLLAMVPERYGEPKVRVCRDALRLINPEVDVMALPRHLQDVGDGVLATADLIFGAVDNRATRLEINRRAFALGKPWIDVGMSHLTSGTAIYDHRRTCYEEQLDGTRNLDLGRRFGCYGQRLGKSATPGVAQGSVAPITALCSAAQVWHALRWLFHRSEDGPPILWFLPDGTQVAVQSQTRHIEECRSCASWGILRNPLRLDSLTARTTVEHLLSDVSNVTGQPISRLELPGPLVWRATCGLRSCGHSVDWRRPLARFAGPPRCPRCLERGRPPKPMDLELREVLDPGLLDARMTLEQLGFPPRAILRTTLADGSFRAVEACGEGLER